MHFECDIPQEEEKRKRCPKGHMPRATLKRKERTLVKIQPADQASHLARRTIVHHPKSRTDDASGVQGQFSIVEPEHIYHIILVQNCSVLRPTDVVRGGACGGVLVRMFTVTGRSGGR